MGRLKIGVIGVGQRGETWCRILSKDWQEDTEVVAVCDSYTDRVEKGIELVKECSGDIPKGYSDYHDLLRDPNVEAVIISAAWEAHALIAVDAMRAKKITALEVGGAYALDDCWELVRAYEETKTPFFFMENCCYGERELLATGLVRKGMLGEVVYCHGAYCHDLRGEIGYGFRNRHYRLRNYIGRNCDNYPTHELGPIAKLLNINRGNRMLKLTSVASKACGLEEYVKRVDELQSLVGQRYKQGDVVHTLITCSDGSLISMKLDTTLPRAYSREFLVSGSKGIYNEQGETVLIDGTFDHTNDMREYYNTAQNYKEYLPKIWRDITQEERDVGHGGMDYLMLKAFIAAVKEGAEMPIDVYDAASWMAITCLTEASISMGGMPVEIPDFTRGRWVMREPKDVADFD